MPPPASSARILVADDDAPLGRLFHAVLAGQGHDVEVVSDGAAARRRLAEGAFDVALLDLTLGPIGGLALLEHARRVSPSTSVVIVTGNATVESAVAALKKGAHDYLVKPVRNEQLAVMVRRLVEMKRLGEESRRTSEALRRERRRNETLLRDARERAALSCLAGTSRAMSEVRALAAEVLRADSTVLILGESGTGKSLLARVLHHNSPRADAPFIETHCAVFSEGLLMSELFGHEPGAFTGALRRKKGRVELAEGGTLFLDEIGDMPQPAQLALLRFLQERRFERVGGEETLAADVRVIAATNRDLHERMKDGAFREDLYYRLNVVPIRLPALRERPEDIPALAARLLDECAARLERPAPRLGPGALEALARHPWPGNIREMQNVLERGLLMAHEGVLDERHLPAELRPSAVSAVHASPAASCAGGAGPVHDDPGGDAASLDAVERRHILAVLEQCRWNKKRAAAVLGINRSSLYAKLRRFGLLAGSQAEGAMAGVQEADS
ncbi:MAG TPA: sigma-54 dependent transcriptional regulator [Candidatus Polarisedimenticolia bacterium]|nr:sigma-54 dependent transcriptional regulator [Candidatus Polarisedimenticolia bacterium]